MQAIVDFINHPLTSSLLRTHPNEYDPQALPWSLAENGTSEGTLPGWASLLTDPTPPFREFVSRARALALDRTPMPLPAKDSYGFSKQGMSPKKEHEVTRMISFISALVSNQGIKHAVDVGSGQGYLSRALNVELDLDVLALDSNPNQTTGAEEWTRKQPKRTAAAVTHQTLHVTPESLRSAIDGWISSYISDDAGGNVNVDTPVLFVALHACGPLTVDILRSFFTLKRSAQSARWRPAFLVLVGCCYNLLDTTRDFPLSEALKSFSNLPALGSSAFQLASQIPDLWLSSEMTRKQSELALRKVVFRALFQYIYIKGSPTQRLGKLNDRYYNTWEVFVEKAKSKMEIDENQKQIDEEQRKEIERYLEVLHTLRCLIGPVVESLILLDRIEWVKENVGDTADVRLINLFDQATGSGRNSAIVIEPVI